MRQLLGIFGLAALATAGCKVVHVGDDAALIGAWKGHVRFGNGPLSALKDLEFMYVFNRGGTMTESSNYDESQPVPPAYGVWRKVGPGAYEARYEFYWTKPPAGIEDITKGGGWAPGGYGVILQTIALSDGGGEFDSKIELKMLDPLGRPADGSGEASATASRINL